MDSSPPFPLYSSGLIAGSLSRVDRIEHTQQDTLTMTRSTTYRFEFQDGSSWNYELVFDEHQRYVVPAVETIRPWTRLEFQKCPHCPLKSDKHPQCPVARNLDRIVEDSKATISWTRSKVTVVTPERTFIKECATQDGLRSLFGLLMACSDCPHLEWLRPLARYHLPFANADESLFRVLSLQLVEDFLDPTGSNMKGSEKRILDRYKAVETVNHSFMKRIRSYVEADADKNAIAALDVFVQMFTLHLESNFSSLRPLFGKS